VRRCCGYCVDAGGEEDEIEITVFSVEVVQKKNADDADNAD
jgi:hypothetical protein